MEEPWILDVDVTVKSLYGNQEGAVRDYNPGKPGRPSHAYHSFWVAHLRLYLDVQVHPGNQTQGAFGLGKLLNWLRGCPLEQRPEFVRGDISYGTQKWMQELEDLDVPYLFRLKQWASLIAEQLKMHPLWKRIIEHILSHHRSFGGQNYRAPPMIDAST